jgi:hypothetical protein
MQAPATAAPLVCHGHSRPIVNLEYSQITDDGVFLISSSKGAKNKVSVPFLSSPPIPKSNGAVVG